MRQLLLDHIVVGNRLTLTDLQQLAGTSATTGQKGLDRFWRNLRTHSLHDPVDYKLQELGNWALNDSYPQPSFYA